MREFFIANAGYWIDEFHLDGLRLDAVQAIVDDSPDHILAAITRRVREAGGKRKTIVTAENEFQESRLLRAGRSKAASGSTRLGTTIFIMRPASRSPAIANITTAITKARRKNSFPR